MHKLQTQWLMVNKSHKQILQKGSKKHYLNGFLKQLLWGKNLHLVGLLGVSLHIMEQKWQGERTRLILVDKQETGQKHKPDKELSQAEKLKKRLTSVVF